MKIRVGDRELALPEFKLGERVIYDDTDGRHTWHASGLGPCIGTIVGINLLSRPEARLRVWLDLPIAAVNGFVCEEADVRRLSAIDQLAEVANGP